MSRGLHGASDCRRQLRVRRKRWCRVRWAEGQEDAEVAVMEKAVESRRPLLPPNFQRVPPLLLEAAGMRGPALRCSRSRPTRGGAACHDPRPSSRPGSDGCPVRPASYRPPSTPPAARPLSTAPFRHEHPRHHRRLAAAARALGGVQQRYLLLQRRPRDRLPHLRCSQLQAPEGA